MSSKLKCLLISILVFIASCTLTACGPVYQTTYNFTPPKSMFGRQCINMCLQNRSDCNMNCQRNNTMCRTEADMAAQPAYKAYLKDQREKNLTPSLSVSNFANYGACTSNCGCDDTYRQCYTNCGGAVVANTQCVANCDKVQPVPPK